MADRVPACRKPRDIAAPTLSEITVLELTDFDDNGDGMARLAGNDMENSQKSALFLAADLDVRQQLPANSGPACPSWPGAI